MVRIPLKGSPIPWVVGGAALVAAPVVAVVNKVLGRQQLKKLPIHILTGPGGLEVHISPLGGVIQRLLVPDRDGKLEDIVLGYDDIEQYAVSSCIFMGKQRTVSGQDAIAFYLLSIKGLKLPILLLMPHKATASGWHASQLYEKLHFGNMVGCMAERACCKAHSPSSSQPLAAFLSWQCAVLATTKAAQCECA